MEEQVGKGTDASVDEGHAVERVLRHSFYELCESQRRVGVLHTTENCSVCDLGPTVATFYASE